MGYNLKTILAGSKAAKAFATSSFEWKQALWPYLLAASLVTGCASNPSDSLSSEPASDDLAFDEPEAKNSDPFEGFNRKVFVFNDTLDKYLAKPAAKGYKAISPSYVEKGVNNFFGNLGDVSNAVNSLLQGKWGQAGHDSSRVMLNTVAGLGGLVDVAAEAGLEKNQPEDFGQTLSVWGVPKGPFIVLPVLGPATLVDVAGMPVDWATWPVSHLKNDPSRYGLTAIDLLNTRAGLLGVDDIVSGDRYLFIREAYLQNREFRVNDGVVEDDFGGDMEDFGEFEKF